MARILAALALVLLAPAAAAGPVGVSITGDAQGDIAAVSVTGDATADILAVTVTGHATALVPISVTGGATQCYPFIPRACEDVPAIVDAIAAEVAA